MTEFYTIKSNARRAARKAGVDPNTVYCVPQGWKFPEPPNLGSVLAEIDPVPDVPAIERIETVAAEPEQVPTVSAVMEQIAAKLAPADIEAVRVPPNPDQVVKIHDLSTKPRAARKPKPAKVAKPTKAKPAAKPRGKRDGVCDRVIAAIHARWTSIDELLTLSGWQRHTLRGYISTRSAKDGFKVEKRKVDGVPQYRVAG